MLQILAMCNIFTDKGNAFLKSVTLYGNPLTLCQYIELHLTVGSPTPTKDKKICITIFFSSAAFVIVCTVLM